MIIAMCLDNNNGMMFNGRRQSRDSAVIKDVLNLSGGSILVSVYSAPLFPHTPAHTPAHMPVSASDNNSGSRGAAVRDDFLDIAGEGQWCFNENHLIKEVEDRIEKIVVYRWNKVYPSDMKLDICLDKWKLVEQYEFKGTSHDVIAREVYVR